MKKKNQNNIVELGNYDLNIVPTPYDDRDWHSNLCLVPFSRIGEVPKTLDYREYLNKPRDQKSEGQCAAFSCCAMKEVQERIDCGYRGFFSPQFVYNQRENRSEGMHTKNVMDILYKVGVVRERSYRFLTRDPITPELLKEAANFRIKHYARVNSVMDAKNAIFQTGPILIAVPVYGTSTQNRMWYPSGVIRGGHMMTLVAYNEESFIVRNSWGDTWNGNGYCNLNFNDWSYIWEAWTTTDADSKDVPPEMLQIGRAHV